MDIGIPLITIPFSIYCLYSFKKSKQNIFLIVATLSWTTMYSGKYNVYQFLQEPLKSIINMITIGLLLLTFMPYLRESIRQYREYRKYKR
ncbi:hypothetical protein EUAN_24100 [Andreesenia angusta]|uniref:Uncharacterized protein n=1 Tax=Andreesenia angusta TaxID=39480 RepID=A0A1S1V4A7_9FIRM|nr:hypothetical protein EUAN_24100 [Andreesenia angusta]